MKNQKTYPPRSCEVCGEQFAPTGPAARFCGSCGEIRRQEAAKRGYTNQMLKKGRQPGVGSGNAQGRGCSHHSFKNGISYFHAFSRTARESIRYCQRCDKDLLDAGRYEWVVHHRNHDRQTNDPSNWEFLCKACHQKEHQAWRNFYKHRND